MGQAERAALVLMAKWPAAGQTKTRLSPPLSPALAAELTRCFLLDKLAQMRRVTEATPLVAYTPPAAADRFRALAPDCGLVAQEGDGLAQRLRHVCAVLLAQGYQRVMAIDGDTPHLPTAYLRQGLARLSDDGVDVVLGPTEDGGYYAIGLKRPHPALFDVTMSTPRVLADTLTRADAAGLRVALLPCWYDVDTPADLARLASDLAQTPDAAPATARFLRERGVGSGQ